MKRNRGILWDILCIGTGMGCIIIVVMTSRLVFTLEGDNCAQTYALFAKGARVLQSGEISLWNPHLWGGFPNMGNFITESCYPVNWVLCNLFYNKESNLVSYAIVPCNLILHLSIYFAGMYFLLKKIGFSRLNSFSVGVTSTLCCSLFSYMYWLVYIDGFCWLPFILLCAIVMFEAEPDRKLIYSVILGVLFATEASVSVSLMLVISVFIFGILFITYLFGNGRDCIASNVKYSILSGVLGILLVAPLILSSLTFMQYMVRYVPDMGYVTWGTRLPIEEYTKHVCEPYEIWQMLDFHNNANAELPEISRLSVSAFILLFCIVGFFSREKKNIRLYYLSFFGFWVCLSACFGIIFPAAFYYIPGLNQMREAIMYGILVNMFASILAAYGFHSTEQIVLRKVAIKEEYWCKVFLATALTALVVYNILTGNVMCILFAVLAVCFLVPLALKRDGCRRGSFYLCTLLFAGLCVKDVHGAMNIFTYTERQAVKIVEETCKNTRGLVEYIEGLDPKDTYYRMTGWGYTSVYPENMASILGFYDVKGYLNPSLEASINIHTMLPLDKKAQLQNIKYYLVSARDDQDVINSFEQDADYRKVGEVTEIYSDWDGTARGTVYIYQPEKHLGDAWVVSDMIWNDSLSEKEILQGIAGDVFDIGTTAVVEQCRLTERERALLDEADVEGTESSVLCSLVTDNRIVYEVNSGGNGILVTTEIYYPGWEVYVNWEKETLLQVDGTNRGAVVPEGNSRVEFRYRPAEIRIGMALQAVGGIACLLMICSTKHTERIRKRKQQRFD